MILSLLPRPFVGVAVELEADDVPVPVLVVPFVPVAEPVPAAPCVPVALALSVVDPVATGEVVSEPWSPVPEPPPPVSPDEPPAPVSPDPELPLPALPPVSVLGDVEPVEPEKPSIVKPYLSVYQ